MVTGATLHMCFWGRECSSGWWILCCFLRHLMLLPVFVRNLLVSTPSDDFIWIQKAYFRHTCHCLVVVPGHLERTKGREGSETLTGSVKFGIRDETRTGSMNFCTTWVGWGIVLGSTSSKTLSMLKIVKCRCFCLYFTRSTSFVHFPRIRDPYEIFSPGYINHIQSMF